MGMALGGTIQADIRDGMSRIARVVLSQQGNYIEPFPPLLLRNHITGDLLVVLHFRSVSVKDCQQA